MIRLSFMANSLLNYVITETKKEDAIEVRSTDVEVELAWQANPVWEAAMIPGDGLSYSLSLSLSLLFLFQYNLFSSLINLTGDLPSLVTRCNHSHCPFSSLITSSLLFCLPQSRRA